MSRPVTERGALGPWWLPLALSMVLGLPAAAAAAGAEGAAQAKVRHERWPESLREWLQRLHEASQQRSFVGTLVVSAEGEMSSSRIWHLCDGRQQLERIETLTGDARVTLRRDDEVLTLLPAERLAVRERRASLGRFPDILSGTERQIGQWYLVRNGGLDRVAGHEALVVDFVPRDELRYGYRLWSERKTGLVLKLQTRDAQGQVLEQVAFTEIQFDPPLRRSELLRQIEHPPKGYQVVQPQFRDTSPEAEGWRLRRPVPGFEMTAFHVREGQGAPLHWVFSDGLASVSIFLETFQPERHSKGQAVTEGATHTVSQRIGHHWATAMGEVPFKTLQAFLSGLERQR